MSSVLQMGTAGSALSVEADGSGRERCERHSSENLAIRGCEPVPPFGPVISCVCSGGVRGKMTGRLASDDWRAEFLSMQNIHEGSHDVPGS